MKTELTATNQIAFELTPAQTMELIKNLSSYAMDGKTFRAWISTSSTGWDSKTPVATISCNGFMNLNANLLWSATSINGEQTLHYDSTDGS
jgi:hypothetical protein